MPRPLRAAPLLLITALLGGCGAARSGFVTPLNTDRFFIAGYHAYWAEDAWRDYPADALDEVYFFEIEVAGDGSFLDRHGWPGRWTGLIEWARRRDVQLTPTVSMHDPEAFERLFRDRTAVERLVDEIGGLVLAVEGLAGVHLDLEVFQRVAPEARDGFTAFVRNVAVRLDEIDPDLSLSVFALAFDDDDVYDEPALAEVADYIVIQGYDYHSIGSENAGPVAAVEGWGRLNWRHVVERFDGFGVPRRKIVMAVPLYGYEWPVEGPEPGALATGPAVAVPLRAPPEVLPELPRARDRIAEHPVSRDRESGSPFYVFRDGDVWYQGWFEDAESLAAKYEFVRAHGLGGLAVFPAAYADDEIWEGLERMRRRRR